MMLQGQLGQPQQPPVIIGIPTLQVRVSIGLLGNRAIQVPAELTAPNGLLEVYRELPSSGQPAFKLALLKRQTFSPEGRQARIAASLAALAAPQPTDLSLAQWKEIVEEVEDED